MADNEYLTTRQAATLLGLSLGTVQHMVENGVLEAWKTVGGHRRIKSASVKDYMATRQQSRGAQRQSPPLDVLIAEDEPTLQELYRRTFDKWDIPLRLRLVDNGFDGLLEVGKQQPDVLITDLLMPGMDGFEMIRRLRANRDLADMTIVVVSALEADEIEAQGGFPGDIAVYGKPIPFAEIKGFIQALYRLRQRHLEAV